MTKFFMIMRKKAYSFTKMSKIIFKDHKNAFKLILEDMHRLIE